MNTWRWRSRQKGTQVCRQTWDGQRERERNSQTCFWHRKCGHASWPVWTFMWIDHTWWREGWHVEGTCRWCSYQYVWRSMSGNVQNQMLGKEKMMIVRVDQMWGWAYEYPSTRYRYLWRQDRSNTRYTNLRLSCYQMDRTRHERYCYL